MNMDWPTLKEEKAFRSAARRELGSGAYGKFYVDENAIVSSSEDGAYVACWVWVPREDLGPG